jgi:hypothetical protein
MWAKEKWVGGDVHVAHEEFRERTDFAGGHQARGGKWRIGCGTGIVGACADSRRHREGDYNLSSLGEYWDSHLFPISG